MAAVYYNRMMKVITVKRIVRAVGRKSARKITFNSIRRDYFANETKWQFAIEAFLFGIIVIISTWPIFTVADALNQFLQRT